MPRNTPSFAVRQPVERWRHGYADAGRARALSKLGPTFGLTGTDSVSNLVRRAERRRQSAEWRKTVREIEASLGLNTEHKA